MAIERKKIATDEIESAVFLCEMFIDGALKTISESGGLKKNAYEDGKIRINCPFTSDLLRDPEVLSLLKTRYQNSGWFVDDVYFDGNHIKMVLWV